MRIRKEDRGKAIQTLQIVLLVLTLAVIWGQSFLSVKSSLRESKAVFTVVNAVKKTVSGGEKLPEKTTVTLIRKSAHAAEFALLGFEFLLLFRKKPLLRKLVFPLFFCVLCGLIDETIQLFNDRTSLVGDVWLDAGGALAGIALGLLLLYALSRAGKKKTRGDGAPPSAAVR